MALPPPPSRCCYCFRLVFVSVENVIFIETKGVPMRKIVFGKFVMPHRDRITRLCDNSDLCLLLMFHMLKV